MKRNGRLATPGATLLALIAVTLGLVPGAWAQSKYKTLHTFTRGAGGEHPMPG
jgi:hypothetical protein